MARTRAEMPSHPVVDQARKLSVRREWLHEQLQESSRERLQLVLDLRDVAGCTWPQVAELLGVAESRAHQLHREAVQTVRGR